MNKAKDVGFRISSTRPTKLVRHLMIKTNMIKNQYWVVNFLVSLLLILTIKPESLKAADGLDEEIARLQANARIDWGQVTAPIDKFLLIRKSNDMCAVRFTEFHRGHDAKPPTVFHSGEVTLYAEYDWYCQRDGSGDFTKPNIQSGHSKLERKPLRGIGRLAFQTGERCVKCGPFKLYWRYPTSVAFYGVPKQGDYRVELSPTRWTEINNLNTHDSHLKWHRCDEHRKTIYIPIE